MMSAQFAWFLIVAANAVFSELHKNRKIRSTFQPHWTFYLEEDSRRMVATVNDEHGILRDCYAYGDRILINTVLKRMNSTRVVTFNSPSMHQLADICTKAKWNGSILGGNGEEVFANFGIFSGFFIYPGTKWCGAGNISEGYDDLGPEVEADRCCRDHDHCNDSIPGFDSKYGLHNFSPFTKSHCDCDGKFQECLKEANTKASNRVGKIFFNVIKMECFRQDFPITGCLKYKGRWPREKCQEYEFDEGGEPYWQMFDAKYYETDSDDDYDDDDNEIEETRQDDVFKFISRLAEDSEYLQQIQSFNPASEPPTKGL